MNPRSRVPRSATEMMKSWLKRKGLLSFALSVRGWGPIRRSWNALFGFRLALAGLRLKLQDSVTGPMGHRMFVLPSDSRSRLLLIKNGSTDSSALRLWLSILTVCSPDVVVDVGANYGEFCLPVLSLPNPPAIIALEPNRAVFRCLRRSFEDADAGESRLIQAAAGAQRGFGSLRVDDRGSGFGSISYDSAEHVQSSTEIVVLNDVVNSRAQGVAIKIDVEGNELDVLRGAAGVFRRSEVVALVEILHIGSSEIAELRDFVYGLNLTAYAFDLGKSRLVEIWPAGKISIDEARSAGYLKDVVLATSGLSRDLGSHISVD